MAKKRKAAGKKKAAKRKVVVKVKGASSRGIRRKKPVKRGKASKSVIGRVVDAVKEAASLRGRLEGHNTFED
jgi:hypothetical protein